MYGWQHVPNVVERDVELVHHVVGEDHRAAKLLLCQAPAVVKRKEQIHVRWGAAVGCIGGSHSQAWHGQQGPEPQRRWLASANAMARHDVEGGGRMGQEAACLAVARGPSHPPTLAQSFPGSQSVAHEEEGERAKASEREDERAHQAKMLAPLRRGTGRPCAAAATRARTACRRCLSPGQRPRPERMCGIRSRSSQHACRIIVSFFSFFQRPPKHFGAKPNSCWPGRRARRGTGLRSPPARAPPPPGRQARSLPVAPASRK